MKIFFTILFSLFSWLKIPLIMLVSLVILFFVLVYTFVIIKLIKGRRFKKGEHYKRKKVSIFKRLFIDLPNQVSEDMFDRDPEAFRYKGLIIFEGIQGSGKTIALVKETMDMQYEYPKCKCISNLGYSNEDKSLVHWSQLIKYTNDIHGVIGIIDETQNWFSSNQSRNFPPEMLEVITQNRKNRRIILGTAQNFYLLSKAIRSQTTEVRRCTTFLGCLTFVHRVRPVLDSEGNVKEWKHRGFYFFVHTPELRNSYDTYKVIKSLANSGFQEQQQPNVTNVFIKNK